MVKYGKEFRKNQNPEWNGKYFDYKAQKKIIKQYLQEREEFNSQEDLTYFDELEKWSIKFEEGLDKDIKKVYIFFANKEKTLYKKINEYLHIKEDYPNFELEQYAKQYSELKKLSELSLNMSNFIFYNLKALLKILKKFDKKIVTPQNKEYLIKQRYIQAKIEKQNSDILYLLKFKKINEVNVILEDLINILMKEFKSNKDRLKEEQEDEKEKKLLKDKKDVNDVINIIKKDHEQIKKNIKEINKVSAEVTRLFSPWKNFLIISADTNSKLLK